MIYGGGHFRFLARCALYLAGLLQSIIAAFYTATLVSTSFSSPNVVCFENVGGTMSLINNAALVSYCGWTNVSVRRAVFAVSVFVTAAFTLGMLKVVVGDLFTMKDEGAYALDSKVDTAGSLISDAVDPPPSPRSSGDKMLRMLAYLSTAEQKQEIDYLQKPASPYFFSVAACISNACQAVSCLCMMRTSSVDAFPCTASGHSYNCSVSNFAFFYFWLMSLSFLSVVFVGAGVYALEHDKSQHKFKVEAYKDDYAAAIDKTT